MYTIPQRTVRNVDIYQWITPSCRRFGIDGRTLLPKLNPTYSATVHPAHIYDSDEGIISGTTGHSAEFYCTFGDAYLREGAAGEIVARSLDAPERSDILWRQGFLLEKSYMEGLALHLLRLELLGIGRESRRGVRGQHRLGAE